MGSTMHIEQLTRVRFDPGLSPGGSPPVVELSFGESRVEWVAFTAKALSALPLMIVKRIKDDAEVIWLNRSLQSAVRSAIEEEIDLTVLCVQLESWSPEGLRWTPKIVCPECENDGDPIGCACCKFSGQRHGEPFYTDLDGRLVETPAGERA